VRLHARERDRASVLQLVPRGSELSPETRGVGEGRRDGFRGRTLSGGARDGCRLSEVRVRAGHDATARRHRAQRRPEADIDTRRVVVPRVPLAMDAAVHRSHAHSARRRRGVTRTNVVVGFRTLAREARRSKSRQEGRTDVESKVSGNPKFNKNPSFSLDASKKRRKTKDAAHFDTFSD
jgi:hypothetical protein